MPASTAPSAPSCAPSLSPYAARIWSSSARYSASASMELMGVGKSVKILLKDDAGGFGVEHIGAALVGAPCRLRLDRRIAFVDPRHRQIEAAVQLIAEALCELRHFVRRAVGMHRQADHERVRLPLGNQLADFGKTIFAAAILHDDERPCASRKRIADRNADALFPVIEREQRRLASARQAHAAPLMRARPRPTAWTARRRAAR